MSVESVLFAVGLVLGIVEEIKARGTNLLAWAVIAIAVGLLLPQFVK